MTEQHPDPGAEAGARAAQLAAIGVSVAEAVALLRSQRQHRQAAADEQAAAATRATASADRAAARLIWSPALDNAWLRGASASELLDAWTAAAPHTGTDPTAARAGQRVEARLRQLHPEAMHVYDLGRAEGVHPQACLHHAVRFFRGPYGLDTPGTPIHQPHDADGATFDATTASAATRQRAATTTVRFMPASANAASTEAPQPRRGAVRGALPAGGPLPVAAAITSRPAPSGAVTPARAAPARAVPGPVGPGAAVRVVVARAYPVSIRAAMPTAPIAAARSLPALPPAPTRRQLTASPHHERRHP